MRGASEAESKGNTRHVGIESERLLGGSKQKRRTDGRESPQGMKFTTPTRSYGD